MLAVIRLNRWEGDIPYGTCVRVLGRADDPLIYDYALLLKNELSVSIQPFRPPIVLLRDVDPEASASSVGDGKRYENITVIDPEGSTDRDDGFHITKDSPGCGGTNGTYLYVHIADVDRYFPANETPDLSLRERVTSVYSLSKVYHMLPEEYASKIISLTSQLSSHYVLTTVFEITENGPVFKEVHQATVTVSDKRSFTYEQAQQLLDRPGADKQIQLLSEITGQTDTHKMIEKIMIWTNSAIAEFIYDHGYNFSVYYPPVPDLVTDNSLPMFGGPRSTYSTTQHGHGMLGLKHYTHFTSPIRRYADIVVHRIVKHIINGDKDSKLTFNLDECCEKVNAVTHNAKNYYRNQNVLKLMDKLPKDGIPVLTTGYILQFKEPNSVSVYLKDYNIVLNTTLFSRELLDIVKIELTEETDLCGARAGLHVQVRVYVQGKAHGKTLNLPFNTETAVSLVYLPSEIRLHKKVSVTFPSILTFITDGQEA